MPENMLTISFCSRGTSQNIYQSEEGYKWYRILPQQKIQYNLGLRQHVNDQARNEWTFSLLTTPHALFLANQETLMWLFAVNVTGTSSNINNKVGKKRAMSLFTTPPTVMPVILDAMVLMWTHCNGWLHLRLRSWNSYCIWDDNKREMGLSTTPPLCRAKSQAAGYFRCHGGYIWPYCHERHQTRLRFCNSYCIWSRLK